MLKVKCLALDAQTPRCGGCFGVSFPPLMGFELCLDGSGDLLRCAIPPADQDTALRLQRVQAWICRALEYQQEVYTQFYSHHIWTYVIPVEWPMNDRESALAHLAGGQSGLHLVHVQMLASRCRFAGEVCPVCLEEWESMAVDANAVALPCGHACCSQCLGPATGVNWWSVTCPVCRVAPTFEGRTFFPVGEAYAAF